QDNENGLFCRRAKDEGNRAVPETVGGPLSARRATLCAALVVLAILGLAPITVMFVRSLTTDGAFGLENYRHLLATRRSWQLLTTMLGLALATAVTSTVVGLPLGLLFAKTDLPLRRLFVLLFALPLVIPPYITAVSWADTLAPHGLASRVFGGATAQVASHLLF